MTKTIVCPACDGAGWSGTKTCERCHGTGNVKRPMTNGDRIRSMTDEEIATELLPLFEELCEDGVPSPEYMRFWLRQIAEEDA